jgi:hypothetical protein
MACKEKKFWISFPSIRANVLNRFAMEIGSDKTPSSTSNLPKVTPATHLPAKLLANLLSSSARSKKALLGIENTSLPVKDAATQIDSTRIPHAYPT